MYVGIIRHKVRNFAAWKRVYDGHEARRAAGLGDGRVLRTVDAPNDVVVILEFDDPRRFKKFAASDELKRAMRAAGVIGRPSVVLCRDPAAGAIERRARASFLEVEAHPS